MKEIITNDGKKGGWLKGKPHYDKDGKPLGGIKAVVTDAGGKPVELEGGEVIINKEASAKHWKELSRINQSAGNGVAIGPPSGADYDEDPEEYKEGGKVIEFNANHVPNKWILNYAKNIKEKHPEIWKLGGNIFGNQAFINLKRVSERGYWLDSEKWMYIKWRSYVARHKKDFRIEGVVAMLKWVDKVDKGWAYMKDLIEERIDKIKDKKEGKGWKHKMKNGGGVNDRKGNIKFMEWYVVWYKKISDKINITFSLPHKLSPFKEKNVVILDLFETTDQNIDAKPYLEKIVNKADEYGVTIYLEPMPRYKFSYYQKFGFELTADKNFMKRLPKSNTNEIGSEVMKSGGKTIAQTPAPKKERIYGSKVNKPESAASESKAKSIKLDEATIEAIKNKIKGTGISLATAKAVVRRGMGAYSSSHRPTITGGKPNSRVAWGLARLNAFLYKAEHGKSKSGKYTQDDDLLRESGFRVSKMGNGGKVNGLNIIIKNIGDHSKKYFGVYKKIFDIIEENIAFYNPYGTSYEEIKGNDFYITITPYPEQFIINKISKLKNVEIVDSFHLGGDMSKHLAPNGKPSNLTHEQWHLVRTPEFKAWFGDWENDPKNASKVVDENGEPLVVYHGSSKSFTKFKDSEYSNYIFFSNDIDHVEVYGDVIYGCFLSIKNPSNKLYPKETLKEQRKDGFINHYQEKSFFKERTRVYATIKSTQIKLADGTNTTFDGSNPDIRYADGGQTFYERTYADGTKKRFSVDEYEKNIYPYLPLGNGGNVDIAEWETKEPELFKCLLTIRALVEANAVVKDSFIDTHNNIYVIKYEDSNPYFDSIITETCKTLTDCEDYLEVDKVEVTDKFVLVPLVKNNDRRYAEGGELAKGIKTEQEHRKTLEKIASGELSVDQAIERTAKDHLKEDPNYYTKLLQMESKMAFGGLLEIGLEGILQGRPNKNVRVVGISNKIVTYIDTDTGKETGLYKDKFIDRFTLKAQGTQPVIQQKVMPSSVSILPLKEGDYFTLEGAWYSWAQVLAIGKNSIQVHTGDSAPKIYSIDNIKKWIDKGELKVIPDPTKILPIQQAEAIEKAEEFDYTSLYDTEKFVPSTDQKTWNAIYNIGDKVRIRVDMSMNVNIPYDSPANEFTIKSINKSAATPFRLDKSGNNVGGFQRPENPTGVLYTLDKNGGNWEGKDLELIAKGSGKISQPAPKKATQEPRREKPKPVENAIARLDEWAKVNMNDVLPIDEDLRVKKALGDLALSLSVPTKTTARNDSEVIFAMLNKK